VIDETVRAVRIFFEKDWKEWYSKRNRNVFKKKAKENQGARTDILATLPESKPVDTRKELSKVADTKQT
jgi:hypothetical protein